jgi:hypothetical protein
MHTFHTSFGGLAQLAGLMALDALGRDRARELKAASERPMFAGKLTVIFGSTALNLVHAKSIPNDLRFEKIPPGGIKFLFSSCRGRRS